jgi:hypothetical protein
MLNLILGCVIYILIISDMENYCKTPDWGSSTKPAFRT